jgi:hypothetical protein
MPNLRSLLKDSPWLGWVVAALCLGVAGYMTFRQFRPADVMSPERMRDVLTIRYADTGEVVEIPRGRLDKMLRTQGGLLDPNVGLINPKTNQPTGFLFNKDEWNDLVGRINADKKAMGIKDTAKPIVGPSTEPPKTDAPTTPAPRK